LMQHPGIIIDLISYVYPRNGPTLYVEVQYVPLNLSIILYVLLLCKFIKYVHNRVLHRSF